MLDTVNVYYIFYGTWTAAAKNILIDLAKNIGGTDYIRPVRTFFDANGLRPSGKVKFVQSMVDSYSQGHDLTQDETFQVVSNAIKNQNLPADPNGVYMVLAASDVTQPKLCTEWCGWHTSSLVTTPGVPPMVPPTDIKYAFIGNPDICPDRECNPPIILPTDPTPNGNASADGMANTIAHELIEAISDPDIDAWVTNDCEGADICVWQFSETYDSNGSLANTRIGARDFLLQEQWLNLGQGSCVQKKTNATHVGVIPNGTSCPSGSAIRIRMDDEDSSNADNHGGWQGGFESTNNTLMRFCKVSGSLFKPLTQVGGQPRPYAVLKLGDTCPPGAKEFSRYFDNEDADNANATVGEIYPNVSIDQVTTATRLYFCVFEDGASTMSSFPNLGGSYGLFGSNGNLPGNTPGFIYTDDEDNNNRDSIDCGDGSCPSWDQVVAPFPLDNSKLFLAKVK